jgi:hypothetical protein
MNIIFKIDLGIIVGYCVLTFILILVDIATYEPSDGERIMPFKSKKEALLCLNPLYIIKRIISNNYPNKESYWNFDDDE